ncbi:MAG: hypothetical protein ABJH98_17865 [Reichenbachiella sp.]|uniref:hypothetical protein n=1 Tax=Reichenbachiella sp. TaxID=2184521 RepID=UPI00329744B4
MDIPQNESLTYDHEGYIYYKDIQVEHYSPVQFESMNDMIADPEFGQKLLKNCQHLESLGLRPDSALTPFRDHWFAEIHNKHDPFLFFACNYHDMFIKDDLIAFTHKFSYAPKEIEHNGILIHYFWLFNTTTRKIFELKAQSRDIFYHYISGKGFNSLNPGKNKNSGGIFATRTQWEKACKRLNIPYYILDVKKESDFWKFACRSMENGYEIEVPERMYDHFLNSLPPLRMLYPYKGFKYFINPEIIKHTKEGRPLMFAFRQQGNRFFGTTLCPDKMILANCK